MHSSQVGATPGRWKGEAGILLSVSATGGMPGRYSYAYGAKMRAVVTKLCLTCLCGLLFRVSRIAIGCCAVKLSGSLFFVVYPDQLCRDVQPMESMNPLELLRYVVSRQVGSKRFKQALNPACPGSLRALLQLQRRPSTSVLGLQCVIAKLTSPVI